MGEGVPGRIEELPANIRNAWHKAWARVSGDTGSWTRKRRMPLVDVLMSILNKKGLSATMEVRQFFQATGREDATVSKQDYLQ
jgi:hypothetical protein